MADFVFCLFLIQLEALCSAVVTVYDARFNTEKTLRFVHCDYLFISCNAYSFIMYTHTHTHKRLPDLRATEVTTKISLRKFNSDYYKMSLKCHLEPHFEFRAQNVDYYSAKCVLIIL